MLVEPLLQWPRHVLQRLALVPGLPATLAGPTIYIYAGGGVISG